MKIASWNVLGIFVLTAALAGQSLAATDDIDPSTGLPWGVTPPKAQGSAGISGVKNPPVSPPPKGTTPKIKRDHH
jgi:hypothetical protein